MLFKGFFGGPSLALVELLSKNFFQELHIAPFLAFPITVYVIVDQQFIIKKKHLMDKAFDDPATVFVNRFIILRLGKL